MRNRAYGDRLYEFHGGARASDADKYYNRRSEVWGLGEWLAAGAQIPDDPEMETDLCGLQYGYSSKSQVLLIDEMICPECGQQFNAQK